MARRVRKSEVKCVLIHGGSTRPRTQDTSVSQHSPVPSNEDNGQHPAEGTFYDAVGG
jgi:hypothetical protein